MVRRLSAASPVARSFLIVMTLASPLLAQGNYGYSCESRTDRPGQTTHTSAAVDMGGGIVAQRVSVFTAASEDLVMADERTAFELCGSGQEIKVMGDHFPYAHEPLTDAASIVAQGILAPEPVTLVDLAGRITSMTVWDAAVFDAPASESCGCSVFYPGARP
jgi:hypothetical protein